MRIIFTAVGSSIWSFDEVRGQYYFHRFYKEQPDLNYDKPAVLEDVLSLGDFWMGKGLAGFRLDAIPYFYDRDDTGGESIPETIEFIESCVCTWTSTTQMPLWWPKPINRPRRRASILATATV